MEQRDEAHTAPHVGTQRHSERAADHTDPASDDTDDDHEYAEINPLETTSMIGQRITLSYLSSAESDATYLQPVPSAQERQHRGYIPPLSSGESTGTAQRAPTGGPATTRNKQAVQLPFDGSDCSQPPPYFAPPVPPRTSAACANAGRPNVPPPLLPKPPSGNSRPPEKIQHDVFATRQTPVRVQNTEPRTVEFQVSGQPHPQLVYELYFKNRENAGGPVDSVMVDEEKGVIQITFVSAEVAKAVCEIRHHKIGGQEVEVKLCCPPKPGPNYQKKLLFQNVPEGVDRDLLQLFLESVTGCESEEIIFGDDEGVVLATFDSVPDFDKVQGKCKQKKLKETCLAVSKVPVTNCILVENLATETPDCTIELFFENTKRSGGGPVQKVQRFPQRSTCLVFFEDYQVLDSLSKELVLGKKQLKVRPYFECLGSSGGTEDPSVFTIPKNVVVKDKLKSTFLTKCASPFEELQQLLQPLHAQIGISEDTMTVECKLTPSVPKARSLAKTWAADVEQITADFLSRLQVKRIEVMQHVRPLIDQTVNQAVRQTGARALVEPTQNGLIVVGLQKDVDTASHKIEGIIKAAEEDIERQKLVVEETIDTLKRHKIRLLSVSLYCDTMRRTYPDLEVKIDDNRVRFRGMIQDVKNGQVAMYALLQEEEKVLLQGLTPAAVQVFVNKRTQDYILSTFRKHNITAVLEVERPEVCVYALSKTQASHAERIARGSVLTTVIHLSPESSDLLYSPSMHQMLSQLITGNPGLDVTPADDQSKVFITATDDVIKSITSEIKDFIKNNTFYRQEVLFSPTRHRFISSVWNKRLTEIVDELKNEQVAMEAENNRFLASGTETGLEQLTEKLKALEEDIIVHEETIDSEDRLKFLNSDKREKDFKELEKAHSCAVGLEWETPGVQIKLTTRQTEHHVEMGAISRQESEACFTGTASLEASQVPAQVEPQPPRTASAPRTAIKKRSPEIVVTIVPGEIAQQQVDVIVNSTSTDLDLRSGAISSSILQAAGMSLQTECKSKYPSRIKRGEIAITKGHALSCKELYHLSLPSWAGPQTQQLLHQTTMECLAKCDKSGHTSIAIPALGTGNLSYPKDEVAQTMIGAVRQFERDNPSTSLREVKLVVYYLDTQILQAFQMANSSPASPRAAPLSPQPTRVPAAASQTSISGTLGGHSLPKLAVSVVKGEIAQEKADVIVNSTSTDLDLSSGAVSSSILQVAGMNLQTECNTKYPNGIKIGEIAVTKGHALGCKELYHLSLPSWAGPQTKQALHQTVMECLTKCNQSGFTSIAIPALGTGNLSYPRDEVAQTMIGAVRLFEQTCPSRVVREVKLVVYHQDIQQAFQQAIGQHPATAAVSNSPRPAFGLASGGNFTMSIVTGEIAQQKVSVIVNSTTRTLDLSGGAVSSSILLAAGGSLQTECNTKYPNGIKIGEIATTKGHALACKELYHLSLPTWAGPQTKQVLHQTVMDCLTKCNQSGFTSIAIPALGTGNLSYPRDEVAQAMIGAVRQFEQTCPSSVLREVKLVVYHTDTQTVQQFQKYQNFGVRQLLSSPSTQQPTTNRRANRTFSGPTDHNEGLGATSADYGWEHDVMGVQVRVRKGDISEEDANAILRMTNTAESDQDLADKALRSKCGKHLDEELRNKHAEIEDKGVAVTRALGLKCSFLVHIDAHRFSKDVSSGIKAALVQANTPYRASSIAISAMGIAPDKLGSELFKAMSKFFSSEKDRSIKEVRVILRDELEIPQFTQAMEKHLNKRKDGNSLWTAGKRFFQAAKQKLSGTQTSSPVVEGRRPLASVPSTTMAKKGTKLYIYAENDEAVKGFLEAFDDRVKDRVLRMDYTEDALRSMKKVQIDKICEIAAEQDVEIKMMPEQGRYELKGLNNVLLKVQKRISDFVREAEHRIRESEKESFIKGMVQWSYLEVTRTGTEKHDYGPKENKIIETAFLDKKKTAEIVDSKGIIYVIDFDKMEEYPQNDPSKEQRVNVIRKTRESDSGDKRLPGHWEPHGTNKQLELVKLKTTDKEYVEVERRLRATLGNNSVTIVSVDRIQNVMLYQQYQAKKTNMDEQNGKGYPNEKTLWHGTATDAIQSINNHGFNRSYCGKNATAYGQGVYFAVNSSYSTDDTYSPRDSSGNRFLYQCKVLVGHPTVGTRDMRVLPIRQGHVKYDTATNSLKNPEMYVIFNDTQAYPEYLIKFR